MHVLLTGGMGFIGSHTCLELLGAGYDVTIVDNLNNSCRDVLHNIQEISKKKCSFYHTNIMNSEALKRIFLIKNIDAVMHFAALKSVRNSIQYPLSYYHNNVTGTLSLLEVMQQFKVKNLIFSSSATVYGAPDQVPVTETMLLKDAVNTYGASKQMIERILSDLHCSDHEWNISILRYFNPAGAHSSGKLGEHFEGVPNNLFPFIMQVASGHRSHLDIFGDDYPTPDGTCVRDYIHIMDLALGHLAAMQTHEHDRGLHVYNLGMGKGFSVLDIVKAVTHIVKKEIPFRIVDRRQGDISAIYADPSKAYNQLNWKTTRSLQEIIEDAWRWQVNCKQRLEKYP